MGKVAIKPDASQVAYVTVTAGGRGKARKSKCTTVYGMTPTQVVSLLREAVQRRAEEAIRSDAAANGGDPPREACAA